MILLNLLFGLQMASAQWFDQGWNLELAFGVTNHEITNPNLSKAVYEGYGGQALAYYPLFQNPQFSFGPQAKYFYSELSNTANTSTLTEDLKSYGVAPGLELRVFSFFVGTFFKHHWMSLDLSGSANNQISTDLNSNEFYVGLEVPFHHWALRLTYLRAEGELPSADTGLSRNSPWAEESVFLSVRYRFCARSKQDQWERSEPQDTEVVVPRFPRRSFRTSPSRLNYLND